MEYYFVQLGNDNNSVSRDNWFRAGSGGLRKITLLAMNTVQHHPRSSMASTVTSTDNSVHDAFVHELAIKLSRALNLINPNDLLARRVIDIASNNDVNGFTQGMCGP